MGITPAITAPVSTTLVCGFLGAGKTTFIKGLLGSSGQRTAVLVNEFGELGLDGADIETTGPLKVAEMPGGCICCSQSENLAETVSGLIRDIRPDRLLIEPSGVAEASAVIRALSQAANAVRLDSVATIVDAATFLEDIEPGAFGGFFTDQVLNADTVLVSKTDLVTGDVREKIKAKILSLNPAALVVGVRFGIPEEEISSRHRGEVKTSLFSGLALDAVSRSLDLPWSRDTLDRFTRLLKAGAFGRVFRAKGLIPGADGGRSMLQFARGELTLEETDLTAGYRITLIGKAPDRAALDTFLSAGNTAPA